MARERSRVRSDQVMGPKSADSVLGRRGGHHEKVVKSREHCEEENENCLLVGYLIHQVSNRWWACVNLRKGEDKDCAGRGSLVWNRDLLSHVGERMALKSPPITVKGPETHWSCSNASVKNLI